MEINQLYNVLANCTQRLVHRLTGEIVELPTDTTWELVQDAHACVVVGKVSGADHKRSPTV